MNVKQIASEWLKANGYDGLCSEACGCLIDDLMPCEYPVLKCCEPGYRNDVGPDDECGCDGEGTAI